MLAWVYSIPSHGHCFGTPAMPALHTYLDFLWLQGFQAQDHIILGVIVSPLSVPPSWATHHDTPFPCRLCCCSFLLPITLQYCTEVSTTVGI